MRHQRSGKKLGRDSAHRKALYANLTASLIEHGRIRTTETKAKAVRPIAEKMITLGRNGSIHARRQALAYLRSQEIVHMLFSEIAPRFKDRPGGYTRVIKLGPRQGDAAPMAYLELVDFVPERGTGEGEGSGARGRLRRRRGAEQPAEQAEATA
jgi:large subunit ribosomal protein L17